ncbi:ATP-binding protein [Melittangium boletus]|uniref:AAA+ ATPase domain-containing protein n=1 Tax=Melittangium boletus DSM 14713 TaxID=1294270 RepID=A0A250IJZ7_9BACT|nr:ATP-binding protein [Melittangium boletus]ATB32109.1 hypothetical protein MEBOL_005585 [Melittangium boletus DSM 14713]
MPTGWKKQSDTVAAAIHSRPSHESETPASTARDAAEAAKRERMEMFTPMEPRRRLDNLIVSKSVQEQISSALSRIHHHQTLYEEWGLKEVDPRGSRAVINLFGPPGTGKTFCAEAIAHHLGRRLISVNYAEIESKYVGDTPKNISAAFQRAQETQSVLFFDEADSVLGKRLTQVTQSADHGVNVSRSVMLLQLDAFEGVVIFATNLARNYDSAFVRRILTHIEFTLPDAECRERLWSTLLPSKLPRVPDVTPAWLSAQSHGLSGGLMVNVLIQAACRAVGRSHDARQVSRDDILKEIDLVRCAIEHVGSKPERVITTREEKVDLAQLPPDVQRELPAQHAPNPVAAASTQKL